MLECLPCKRLYAGSTGRNRYPDESKTCIDDDLRNFLSGDYTSDLLKGEIQRSLRENLYKRTVPCTTRTPRPGERHGRDYIFLSKDEFLAAEMKGQLLETGTYQGHLYGTPRPGCFTDGRIFSNHSGFTPNPSTIKEANLKTIRNGENITIHRQSEVSRSKMQSNSEINTSQFSGEFITVSVTKGHSGFGFTIIGGGDAQTAEFLQIRTIIPGGPASTTKRLKPGDVLMYINDTCILGYSHTRVVDMFQAVKPGESIELTVCRGYPVGGYQTMDESPTMERHIIQIMKGAAGFGFTVVDCSDASHHDERGLISGGQRIKQIFDSTRCGQLKVGDKISRINGRNTLFLSHQAVVDMLKSCPPNEVCIMEVLRSVSTADRQNVINKTMELEKSSKSFGSPPATYGSLRRSDLCGMRLDKRLMTRQGARSCTPGGQLDLSRSITASVQPTLELRGDNLPLNGSIKPNCRRDLAKSYCTRTMELNTTLNIDNKHDGFGFRVIGGREEGSQVSVGYVVPDGVAANEGSLQSGDKIIEIDGVDVSGASHQFAVDLILKSRERGRVRLRIRRDVQEAITKNNNSDSKNVIISNYPFNCTLKKANSSESFGFVILSSMNSGNSVIGKVLDNSPSSRCGRLSVGDRILAVNGTNIDHLKHNDVVALIKESGNQITLTIGAPIVSPEVFNSPHTDSTTSLTSRVVDQDACDMQSTYSANLPRCSSLVKLSSCDSDNENRANQNIGMYRNVGSLHRSTVLDLGQYDKLPCHNDEQQTTFLAELTKSWGGFGFSIRGGREYNMPLFILKIAPGGPAEISGQLKSGDEVLEINGVDVRQISHRDAIELVQKGGNKIKLLVRRTGNPAPTIEDVQTAITSAQPSFLSPRRSRTPMI